MSESESFRVLGICKFIGIQNGNLQILSVIFSNSLGYFFKMSRLVFLKSHGNFCRKIWIFFWKYTTIFRISHISRRLYHYQKISIIFQKYHAIIAIFAKKKFQNFCENFPSPGAHLENFESQYLPNQVELEGESCTRVRFERLSFIWEGVKKREIFASP